MSAAEFRRCLETADIAGVRRMWNHIYPHIPQPRPDAHVLMVIHHARTQARSMPLRLRAWSHRWLIDHDYPSGLPDELRPRAERMYPRIAEAVGISVNTKRRSPLMITAANGILAAMNDAVLEAYAEGRTDPAHVRARMQAARERQETYFAELLSGEK